VTVFETARLKAEEAAGDDIAELLAVYLSNPAYLDLTEGSGGVPGGYDSGMLERDLAMSALTPGRHTAVLRLRDGGACVGILDCNDGGMALARSAGMREVERTRHRVAAGDRELAVMELAL
jgi:hypothetical protein